MKLESMKGKSGSCVSFVKQLQEGIKIDCKFILDHDGNPVSPTRQKRKFNVYLEQVQFLK